MSINLAPSLTGRFPFINGSGCATTVTVAVASVVEPRCAHCSRTSSEAAAAGEKLMRCARCRRVFYCGKVCQQASWPAHRADCKAI
jgi:MYND finger